MRPNYSPEEIYITGRLTELVDQNKIVKKLGALKTHQLKFFKDALTRTLNNTDREKTYSSYTNCCLNCFEECKLTIDLHNPVIPLLTEGVIIISNHLGAGKLIKITRTDLITELEAANIKIENFPGFINDDPFVFPAAPIVKMLSETANLDRVKITALITDFSPHLNEVSADCNFVIINRVLKDQLKPLLEGFKIKVESAKSEGKIPVLLIFPEGGTTGKSTLKSPYELNLFNRNYLFLSLKLNLPVLPVIQVFNNELDFVTKLLPVRYPVDISKYTNQQIRLEMQMELDKILHENNISFGA